MPQKVLDVVGPRLEFVLEVKAGASIRQVAARRQVSRSTLSDWVRRYDEGGPEGLVPLSRAPRSSPVRTAPGVEALILSMRDERKRWGGKKIRSVMLREHGHAPSTSTVNAILARNGRIASRPRKGPPAGGWRRFVRESCNDLWHIDATRHLLATGREFWVIDLIDDHSRYLLATHVCPVPTGVAAWKALRASVAKNGLPRQLLSDNGLTFTGRLKGVQVAFERQVQAAGIDFIHAAPYHPETLGKLERQHRTQNEWIADHDRPTTLTGAQTLLEDYRRDYNHVRPHEAIGQRTPAELYQPGRALTLPANELTPADAFPSGAALRHVDAGGKFRHARRNYKLSTKWGETTIGVITDGARVHVYYGSSLIQTFLTGPTEQPATLTS